MVRAALLTVRHHGSPVLSVMVSVDEGEHRVAHVPALRAAGNVEKFEFHCLSVRQQLA